MEDFSFMVDRTTRLSDNAVSRERTQEVIHKREEIEGRVAQLTAELAEWQTLLDLINNPQRPASSK